MSCRPKDPMKYFIFVVYVNRSKKTVPFAESEDPLSHFKSSNDKANQNNNMPNMTDTLLNDNRIIMRVFHISVS